MSVSNNTFTQGTATFETFGGTRVYTGLTGATGTGDYYYNSGNLYIFQRVGDIESASGSIDITGNATVKYYLVGGGGSGGDDMGNGGGGGSGVSGEFIVNGFQTLTITIGDGGVQSSGSDTTITGVTGATGGSFASGSTVGNKFIDSLGNVYCYGGGGGNYILGGNGLYAGGSSPGAAGGGGGPYGGGGGAGWNNSGDTGGRGGTGGPGGGDGGDNGDPPTNGGNGTIGGGGGGGYNYGSGTPANGGDGGVGGGGGGGGGWNYLPPGGNGGNGGICGGGGGGGGGGDGGTPGVGGNGGVGLVVLEIIPQNVHCFKEGSKILTDKGYVPIEELNEGDLVKTSLNGYKPINMIGRSKLQHNAFDKRLKDQLYNLSPEQYPSLFETLVLTGCHSILEDEFVSEEQREKTINVLGKVYVTDDKYRIPACIDERATVYEEKGNYTIYHLALDNDYYYGNYGIYANGLLVESCSKRYLKDSTFLKGEKKTY